MAGLVEAECQSALDYLFPTSAATDYVGYSENGSSESANIARHAIGATGWAAATAAQPSVKANNAQLTSAAATGGGTITHFAVMTSTGTLRTDWQALDTSRTIATDDQLQWAIGALEVTMD